MFSGTIRDNLDPFGLADDVTIWAALDAARLSTHVSSLSGKLEAEAGFVCCTRDQHVLNTDACVFLREKMGLVSCCCNFWCRARYVRWP